MAEEIVLHMPKLQSTIKWSGDVRLHQLSEDSSSFLSEAEWPPRSGNVLYACASTGLLFDKQSGRCLQSTRVSLLIETVEEVKCTAAQFNRWLKERLLTGVKSITIKRGPKPKGQAPISDTEFDDVEVD